MSTAFSRSPGVLSLTFAILIGVQSILGAQILGAQDSQTPTIPRVQPARAFGQPTLQNQSIVVGPGTTQVSLPENKALARGFTVSVTMTPASTYGYATLTISIDSNIKLTAQRDFVLRFTPMGQHLPAKKAAVLEIPVSALQGQRQTQIQRRVPSWTIPGDFEIVLLEDGKPVDDYVALMKSPSKRVRVPPLNEWIADELAMRFARIGDVEVAARVMEQGFTLDASITMDQLPNDWRDFAQRDALLVGFSDLAVLNEPEYGSQTSALRDWVLMGGTLIITGCDDGKRLTETLDFHLTPDPLATQKLADAIQKHVVWYEKSLEEFRQYEARIKLIRKFMDEIQKEAKTNKSSASSRLRVDSESGAAAQPDGLEGFSDPQLVELGRRILKKLGRLDEAGRLTDDPAMPMYGVGMQPPDIWDILSELSEFRPPVWDQDSAGGLPSQKLVSMVVEFNERLNAEIEQQKSLSGRLNRTSVAAGQIIWTPDTNPITETELGALVQTGTVYLSSSLRRGVDPFIGDSRANRWMIPGVAQPPVYTFMGLLGLFVILVGPIAYRQTSKAGRSHLMFAIAPVLAILTTAALLGYSFIADGFGTVTRVRQLTWVDGRSGDAAERVRATYFAGISPTEGLRFAGNAEVMSYSHDLDQNWETAASSVSPDAIRHRIVVTEDEQQFDRSYIPSRSQEQFISHQPKRGIGSLQLVAASGDQSSPSITSTFDFSLRSVVVRDSQGAYWLAEQLPPKAQKAALVLLPSDPTENEASQLLGKMYSEFRPVVEISATRTTSRPSSYYERNRNTRDIVSYINNQLGMGDRVISDGLFEAWLTRVALVAGELPLESFIAHSDVSPDVIAVPDAEIVESIRYVFGTLR